MPEDTSLHQLKMELQSHYGFPITKSQELKNLQVVIESATNSTIGFNTLRRFYGFLEHTNPSIRTLDILSNYLGYQNYFNFKKHQNTDSEWDSWSRIIKIELATEISNEDIQWLIDQAKTAEMHLKLASIVKSFIYNQNYSALNQLFDNRIINFNEDYKLKFASNICQLIRQLDANSIEQIKTYLIPNIVFRENVIHWFIDYTHVKGYYGQLIAAAIPHSKSDSHELLYYELLLNYCQFLYQKNNLLPIISTARVQADFHPVLNGRCFAYNLIYHQHNKNSKAYESVWLEIVAYCKKTTAIHLFTLEIFTALLILKDFEKSSFLIDAFYEDLLTQNNWSGYHIQSNVLLAHCMQLVLENNINEATKTFDLINISKFNTSYKDYSLIFYYLIKYQLAVLDNKSQNELLNIENNYLTLVKSTGFIFFSSDYLKNYLI